VTERQTHATPFGLFCPVPWPRPKRGGLGRRGFPGSAGTSAPPDILFFGSTQAFLFSLAQPGRSCDGSSPARVQRAGAGAGTSGLQASALPHTPTESASSDGTAPAIATSTPESTSAGDGRPTTSRPHGAAPALSPTDSPCSDGTAPASTPRAGTSRSNTNRLQAETGAGAGEPHMSRLQGAAPSFSDGTPPARVRQAGAGTNRLQPSARIFPCTGRDSNFVSASSAAGIQASGGSPPRPYVEQRQRPILRA
jgi:hypothetical protein